MTTNEEHVCGNCKWHHLQYDGFPDWVCVNGKSDYGTDYTDFNDSCEEWEER